jgi:Fe-Mn family superoxide dismutase
MPFSLPRLPYEYDDLEPSIDEETMKLHHTGHHKAYVDSLNDVIDELPDEYKDKNLLELLRGINTVPEDYRDAVRFNAGGHLNHSLFWQMMRPGGSEEPEGKLKAAIKQNFGSFEKMQEQFEEAGSQLYGSGWVWLVVDDEGKVLVRTSANQDSPYSNGLTPILGLDLWEHSYYLNYKNDRATFMQKWWDVVNWEKVAEMFEAIRL